jgi:hypothetical protein
VEADFGAEHVLSIQVSWHPYWSAMVDGEPRHLGADGLGQILVEPRCTGPCTVRLFWDGGTEKQLCRAASGLALVAPLALLFRRRPKGCGRST